MFRWLLFCTCKRDDMFYKLSISNRRWMGNIFKSHVWYNRYCWNSNSLFLLCWLTFKMIYPIRRNTRWRIGNDDIHYYIYIILFYSICEIFILRNLCTYTVAQYASFWFRNRITISWILELFYDLIITSFMKCFEDYVYYIMHNV